MWPPPGPRRRGTLSFLDRPPDDYVAVPLENHMVFSGFLSVLEHFIECFYIPGGQDPETCAVIPFSEPFLNLQNLIVYFLSNTKM